MRGIEVLKKNIILVHSSAFHFTLPWYLKNNLFISCELGHKKIMFVLGTLILPKTWTSTYRQCFIVNQELDDLFIGSKYIFSTFTL